MNDRSGLKQLQTMILFLPLVVMLFLTACQPAILTPPRLATTTAAAEVPPQDTAEPLYLPAPTPTPGEVYMADPAVVRAPSLNVWINETSPEHKDLLQGMMEDFHQKSGVDVSLQMVSPMLLPDLMQTAVLSDTLPDIVLHPLEYTVAWTEKGVLDPRLTGTILDEIGRDTFDPAALELVTVDGQPAAIPSDGFKQIWLYRKDCNIFYLFF